MPYPNFTPEELAGFAAQAQQYQQGMLTQQPPPVYTPPPPVYTPPPVQQTPAYTNNVQAPPVYTPPPPAPPPVQQQYSLPPEVQGLLTQYQQSGSFQNYVPPNLPSMAEMQAAGAAQAQQQAAQAAQAQAQADQLAQQQAAQLAQQQAAQSLTPPVVAASQSAGIYDPQYYAGKGLAEARAIAQALGDPIPGDDWQAPQPLVGQEAAPVDAYDKYQLEGVDSASRFHNQLGLDNRPDLTGTELEGAFLMNRPVGEDVTEADMLAWSNYYKDNPELRNALSVDEQSDLLYWDWLNGDMTDKELFQAGKALRLANGLDERHISIEGRDNHRWEWRARKGRRTGGTPTELFQKNHAKVGGYFDKEKLPGGSFFQDEILGEPLGQLALAIALGYGATSLMGTAATATTAATTGMLPVTAGTLAGNLTAGALTSGAMTALGGGSFKDILKAAAGGAVTAGVGGSLSQILPEGVVEFLEKDGIISGVANNTISNSAQQLLMTGELDIEEAIKSGVINYAQAEVIDFLKNDVLDFVKNEVLGNEGTTAPVEDGNLVYDVETGLGVPAETNNVYVTPDEAVMGGYTYNTDGTMTRDSDGTVFEWIETEATDENPTGEIAVPVQGDAGGSGGSTQEGQTTTATDNIFVDSTAEEGERVGGLDYDEEVVVTADYDPNNPVIFPPFLPPDIDSNGEEDEDVIGDDLDLNPDGGVIEEVVVTADYDPYPPIIYPPFPDPDIDIDPNDIILPPLLDDLPLTESSQFSSGGSGLLGGSRGGGSFNSYMTKLDWKRPDVVQNILLPRQNAFNEITMLTNRLMT